MKQLILLSILTLTLTGCTTVVQRTLDPIGGSKADGTITLAFEYGGREEAHWDWNQGQQAALQRCKAWGYTATTRFNNGMRNCLASDRFGCNYYRVTVQYQCTGQDVSSVDKLTTPN